MVFITLKRLFQHISKKRKFQFNIVLILTLISAVAEMVSLGSVVPFIAIIVQPEQIFKYPLMTEFANLFSLNSTQNMAQAISILFVTAAIFSGLLRVLLLKLSISLSHATGADLSADMFNRTL